jgi:putative transposase
MIFFGKAMLERATKVYLDFYHSERPHQGLKNELIIPMTRPPDPTGEVITTKRLGGLLKSYHRQAA